MYENIALILAGGSGQRIKSTDIPKQFISVNNKPIICYSLEFFQNHDQIDAIVIVCGENFFQQMNDIVKSFGFDKVKSIIPGGKTRQESCYNGLKSLHSVAKSNSVILIHDAARPFISNDIISDNITLTRKYVGATTAVPSFDSLINSLDGETVNRAFSRDGVFCVQTPQSFFYSVILKAHADAVANNDLAFTDDGGLYMKYIGLSLAIVNGSRLNFKITTDDDLKIFKALASS